MYDCLSLEQTDDVVCVQEKYVLLCTSTSASLALPKAKGGATRHDLWRFQKAAPSPNHVTFA